MAASTASSATPTPYVAARPRKETGLATVYIDTKGNLPIGRDQLDGSIEISASSSLPECAGLRSSQIKVVGRGSSTWGFDKKPYNVNLAKEADLCGMGKSSKWTLLANYYDRSLLRTSAAMYIGDQVFSDLAAEGLGWTPRNVPVDLYVNGVFEGSYTLIERIALEKGRIEIDRLRNNKGGVNDAPPNVTGGYLLEWDNKRGSDHNVCIGGPKVVGGDAGEAESDPEGCPGRGWVGIKDPEDEVDGSGITDAQVSYIDSYLEKADSVLFGANFKDPVTGWQAYIDARSAVDYYIGMELTKTFDGNFASSVFMYKARDADPAPGDQGKLYLGPMWDFDSAMGAAANVGDQASPTGWYLRYRDDIAAKQSDRTWFHRLWEDPAFGALVRARWKEILPRLRSTDGFLAAQQSLLSASAAENFKIWNPVDLEPEGPLVQGDWSAEVKYLRTWLTQRVDWITAQYGG